MGGLFLHKKDADRQKTRPTSMCVGAAWVRRPAAIFDHGPFGFNGMFFDYE